MLTNKSFFIAFIALAILGSSTTLAYAVETSATSQAATVSTIISRTLRLGDRGSDVVMLQQFLARDPEFFSVEPTGYYGLKTAEAVKKLQKKMGLPLVGRVGPLTLKSINAVLAPTPSAGAHSTEMPVLAPVSSHTATTPPIEIPLVQQSLSAGVSTTQSGPMTTAVSPSFVRDGGVPPARSATNTAPVATTGCPLFHCTPESTGVMYQPIVKNPSTVIATSGLGTLKAQGCSGDGVHLACLFATDSVSSGVNKGTLKLLDAATLQPIWGSAGVASLYGATNTYDIGSSFSVGEVPLFFSDGRIAAGDGSVYVLYDQSGRAIGVIQLQSKASNMGLTPISAKYGVISQSDGTLTLIDMTTWTKVGDPVVLMGDGASISLASPSSGTDGVLYAVGTNRGSGRGYLFAVVLSTTGTPTLSYHTYAYIGSTGASPVVVKPSITGFSGNLILLHTPGLVSDGTSTKDRLMGLIDNSTGFSNAWAPIVLEQAIGVAPTVDEVTKSFFFQYDLKQNIYQYNLLNGSSTATFDIANLAGFIAKNFKLNGHLGAIQTGSSYSILLSANESANINPNLTGEYTLIFTPAGSSGQPVLWKKKIAGVADQYTAAWNVGPSSSAGLSCPIVVGTTNGISRLCD